MAINLMDLPIDPMEVEENVPFSGTLFSKLICRRSGSDQSSSMNRLFGW